MAISSRTAAVRASRFPRGVAQSGFWIFAVAAALACAALTTLIDIEDDRLALLLIATLVLSLSVAVVGVAVTRDVLSPLPALAIVFLVLDVGRPLFILSENRIGPTRRLDDESLNPELIESMTTASALLLLGLSCLFIGYLCVHFARPAKTRAPANKGERRYEIAGTAVPTLASLAALAVVGFGILIQQAGGFSQYLNNLSNRTAFFLGQGFMTKANLPLKVGVMIVLAAALTSGRLSRPLKVLLGVSLALVMLGDFLTGGRATLLIGTLLPLVVLRHYLHRRLRLPSIVLIVVVAVLFFVVARVVTRDSVYENQGGAAGGSALAIAGEQLKSLPTSTLGAKDAVPYDALTMIVRARRNGTLPFQYGRTYVPIVTFPIPRFVWPDKPLGGNAWFTERYYPQFFGTSRGERTETSISFTGELYINFGIGGVAAGFFILGALLAAGYRRMAASRELWPVVLYAISLGYAITLMRGDAFNSVTNWGLTVVVLAALYQFFIRRITSKGPASPAESV